MQVTIFGDGVETGAQYWQLLRSTVYDVQSSLQGLQQELAAENYEGSADSDFAMALQYLEQIGRAANNDSLGNLNLLCETFADYLLTRSLDSADAVIKTVETLIKWSSILLEHLDKPREPMLSGKLLSFLPQDIQIEYQLNIGMAGLTDREEEQLHEEAMPDWLEEELAETSRQAHGASPEFDDQNLMPVIRDITELDLSGDMLQEDPQPDPATEELANYLEDVAADLGGLSEAAAAFAREGVEDNAVPLQECYRTLCTLLRQLGERTGGDQRPVITEEAGRILRGVEGRSPADTDTAQLSQLLASWCKVAAKLLRDPENVYRATRLAELGRELAGEPETPLAADMRADDAEQALVLPEAVLPADASRDAPEHEHPGVDEANAPDRENLLRDPRESAAAPMLTEPDSGESGANAEAAATASGDSGQYLIETLQQTIAALAAQEMLLSTLGMDKDHDTLSGLARCRAQLLSLVEDVRASAEQAQINVLANSAMGLATGLADAELTTAHLTRCTLLLGQWCHVALDLATDAGNADHIVALDAIGHDIAGTAEDMMPVFEFPDDHPQVEDAAEPIAEQDSGHATTGQSGEQDLGWAGFEQQLILPEGTDADDLAAEMSQLMDDEYDHVTMGEPGPVAEQDSTDILLPEGIDSAALGEEMQQLMDPAADSADTDMGVSEPDEFFMQDLEDPFLTDPAVFDALEAEDTGTDLPAETDDPGLDVVSGSALIYPQAHESAPGHEHQTAADDALLFADQQDASASVAPASPTAALSGEPLTKLDRVLGQADARFRAMAEQASALGPDYDNHEVQARIDELRCEIVEAMAGIAAAASHEEHPLLAESAANIAGHLGNDQGFMPAPQKSIPLLSSWCKAAKKHLAAEDNSYREARLSQLSEEIAGSLAVLDHDMRNEMVDMIEEASMEAALTDLDEGQEADDVADELQQIDVYEPAVDEGLREELDSLMQTTENLPEIISGTDAQSVQDELSGLLDEAGIDESSEDLPALALAAGPEQDPAGETAEPTDDNWPDAGIGSVEFQDGAGTAGEKEPAPAADKTMQEIDLGAAADEMPEDLQQELNELIDATELPQDLATSSDFDVLADGDDIVFPGEADINESAEGFSDLFAAAEDDEILVDEMPEPMDSDWPETGVSDTETQGGPKIFLEQEQGSVQAADASMIDSASSSAADEVPEDLRQELNELIDATELPQDTATSSGFDALADGDELAAPDALPEALAGEMEALMDSAETDNPLPDVDFSVASDEVGQQQSGEPAAAVNTASEPATASADDELPGLTDDLSAAATMPVEMDMGESELLFGESGEDDSASMFIGDDAEAIEAEGLFVDTDEALPDEGCGPALFVDNSEEDIPGTMLIADEPDEGAVDGLLVAADGPGPAEEQQTELLAEAAEAETPEGILIGDDLEEGIVDVIAQADEPSLTAADPEEIPVAEALFDAEVDGDGAMLIDDLDGIDLGDFADIDPALLDSPITADEDIGLPDAEASMQSGLEISEDMLTMDDDDMDGILLPEGDGDDELLFADDDDELNFAPDVDFSGDDFDQDNILDVLRAELIEVRPRLTELDAVLCSTDDDQALLQAVAGYGDICVRLMSACESLGLDGLYEICRQVQDNVSELVGLDLQQRATAAEVLSTWAELVDSYLQTPDDENACLNLITHFQAKSWPKPISGEKGRDIFVSLVNGMEASEEAEPVPERQKTATDEDVALDIAEDTDQDLLEAFFYEAPAMAEKFSESIALISSGENLEENIKQAQRVAHTLKGSANLIGVRGLANLTHHVEDIFEYLYNHHMAPPPPLAELMSEAGDCLESIIEYLQGKGPAPSELMRILQKVLDWANRIDKGQIRAEDRDVLKTTEAAEEAAPAREKPAVDADTKSQDLLRVPTGTVDDMIDLLGEVSIAIAQVQEHITRLLKRGKNMGMQDAIIQQRRFELENIVDVRGQSNLQKRFVEMGALALNKDFDPLEMDQYDELYSTAHSYIEAVADSREISHLIQRELSTLEGLFLQQQRLNKSLQQLVMTTRMVAVNSISSRLHRSVRQACRATGKKVELQIIGEDMMVDSDVLDKLVDPLMHMMRNAVDHGIEDSEVRVAKEKPENGTITLEFDHVGNNVQVKCYDDGGGLDYDKIRAIAVSRGLMSEDEVMDRRELGRMILMSGFSTRETTTQISGRGVGMDVVHAAILDLKGSLDIMEASTGGTLFVLSLPLSLVTNHSLVVRIGKQLYAIPTVSLVQILAPETGQVRRVGDKISFELDKEIYPARSLAVMLNTPGGDPEINNRKIILLARSDNGAYALTVDQLINSYELVVKPMGKYVKDIPGIGGVAVLGDGSVVAVLDIPSLLRHGESGGISVMSDIASAHIGDAPELGNILVVDDSLSVRKSLSLFVKDAGFTPLTARDGLEAVELLRKHKITVALVDMEMPRMNGLELTRHIRATEGVRDLPVIMITSRTQQKHRKEAENAGVTHYLTKPYNEDDLMARIEAFVAAAQG